MKTIQDALVYFSTPVRGELGINDLKSRGDLPRNLHVETEPPRFHPDADTFFGGMPVQFNLPCSRLSVSFAEIRSFRRLNLLAANHIFYVKTLCMHKCMRGPAKQSNMTYDRLSA